MGAPYTWIRFPDATYDALRVDLTPLTDDGGYFWAFQYRLARSESGGYFGLQTNAAAGLGKAVIFSQWNVFEGRGGALGGVSQPFGGEGEGWQNLAHYDWTPGVTHQLVLRFAGPETLVAAVDGTDYGVVFVPGEWGMFATGGHVCWTERYLDVDDSGAQSHWRNIGARDPNGNWCPPAVYEPTFSHGSRVVLRDDGFDQLVEPNEGKR